jgi:diguanylate cyclase (GGDEF)-like protein
VWAGLALAVVLMGSTGAVYLARGEAHDDAGRSQNEFASASAEVASTLQLAIQREQDLVADTGAFVLSNPNESNGAFDQYVGAAEVSQRFPELQTLGEIVVVSPAGLPAYEARAVADPSSPAHPSGSFVLVPPGNRPFYCLVRVGASWNSKIALPAGYDICATSFRAMAVASRDSARGAYIPYPVGDQTWLAVETPIYQGGSVPAKITARRSTFIGWVGTVINPTVVLDRALAGHRDLSVTLRYHVGTTDVSFSAGGVGTGGKTMTTQLRNGWAVTTHATPVRSGILVAGAALGLLLGGLALSLLLGALVYVLATGRARALRTVNQRTAQLRYQALHDSLTGLPNRELILDRVEQALARCRRQKASLAVMFLDLDGFKEVNDTFGHAAGDQLLCEVSDRLSALVRETDTVGRLGGDEFVVVIEGEWPGAGPEVIADRIREVLVPPFVLPGSPEMKLHPQVSIGIAVGVRADAEELLRDADIALYEAKESGKDRSVLFAPEMQEAIQERFQLERDLRASTGSDEFFLAYQPIFDLQANTITGVEALIRWQHPRRGLVMPDEFIPLAEETGLIVPLGDWVLDHACLQAADWDRRGYHLGMSVNVSGRQLDDDVDLVGHVAAALGRSGLAPGGLTLEITETMLMRDPAASASRLQELKAVGVRIAIDDFGTGYSSLGYLQRFPVDALKIDRSFISGAARNPESATLIRSMIQLGRSLGIETLAEGIEERSQLDSLRSEQCDSGQGYLFARPLTPTAVETLMLGELRSSGSVHARL